MKATIILILSSIHFLLTAQPSCLQPENLKALDRQYEQALKNNNAEFFEAHLAEDFIWVHTHATAVDTKADLITRSRHPELSATGNPISRTSRDIVVIRHGPTAVVSGFTTVERESSSSVYSIMRTWVETQKGCKLLACQTMRIPD